MPDVGGWLEGISVGWLLLIGLALFFFPEPITSFWGAVIIGIGIVGFFAGWWSDRQSDSTTGAT
ncbi:hypothetical protein C474_21441 [Halogeometricum pallidum JCM 14848]|uniref:Uncharacterized protein n=1 Tax=Halogeometricum pallidum JCM 14848 TaxID=1227487 RepID=M0CUH3_HALPD|nr:hypothetical protein [Halogeometricum pallidum]ELZ26303.1 hypothetical protein C474_21441 [Halogeometricum pallidum JCM 14848]